jgi:hypothetical protein
MQSQGDPYTAIPSEAGLEQPEAARQLADRHDDGVGCGVERFLWFLEQVEVAVAVEV